MLILRPLLDLVRLEHASSTLTAASHAAKSFSSSSCVHDMSPAGSKLTAGACAGRQTRAEAAHTPTVRSGVTK